MENLPDNTTTSFAHGIENLGIVLFFNGVCQYSTVNDGRPLPYAGSPVIRYNLTNITVQAQSDLSGSAGVITIEYTKSASPAALTSPAPDDTRSIEPEVREEEPIIDEPIEEPVVEVKKTTRKKTTTE